MSSKQLYTLQVLLSNSKDSSPSTETMVGIPYDSIVSLEITESIVTILPKIEMYVADAGTFLDGNPISDKDVLHIKINNNVEQPETEINATFIISGITILSDNYQNKGNAIKIVGYMAADNVFSPYTQNAINGTSNDVIRKISKKIGLKFKSDVTGSENIYWYQDGNNYQYLTHIANRAYVPNDGVFVYGTLDGTINYTTLKTKIVSEPKLTGYYEPDRVKNNVLGDDDVGIMYYDGYEIVDITEIYNNLSNYGGYVSQYDLTSYVGTDLKNMSKMTDLFNQNSKYTDQPVFVGNLGIIGDKPLLNTIYVGKVQNTFTKFQLFSNSISININNSTDVKLFDKVNLYVPSTFDGYPSAEPYSGEYVVTSISHSIVKDASYSKRILLCRNGINKSIIKKDYVGIE